MLGGEKKGPDDSSRHPQPARDYGRHAGLMSGRSIDRKIDR